MKEISTAIYRMKVSNLPTAKAPYIEEASNYSHVF